MRNTILTGDVRQQLALLPDDSIHCVVTSPPYWALRDYGAEGQLGLEATPDEYIANMVEVFRDVRRVLRADGTLWLNLGDTYASGNAGEHQGAKGLKDGPKHKAALAARRINRMDFRKPDSGSLLKAKDLIGIPWRVALALQADGWWLRADIIWAKPNPMPESVADRPTGSHEYFFLLAKSDRYFYDGVAVREKAIAPRDNTPADHARAFGAKRRAVPSARQTESTGSNVPITTRNLRTVWTIATRAYKGAHFATFPEELARRAILAGTSAEGVCAACGAPWERVSEKETSFEGGSGRAGRTAEEVNASGKWAGQQEGNVNVKLGPVIRISTLGWRATCRHHQPGAGFERPIVLDPFLGAGTTALVAKIAGRDYVGIELNPRFVRLSERRIGIEQTRLL